MTNQEIRLKIAELKGWTPWRKYRNGLEMHFLFVPDYGVPSNLFSDESPWEQITFDQFDQSKWYAGNAANAVPRWTENIADAWELAEESGVEIRLEKYSIRDKFEYIATIDRKYNAIFLTAPLAICEAWLAWKIAQ